jgi:hypothetical protein
VRARELRDKRTKCNEKSRILPNFLRQITPDRILSISAIGFTSQTDLDHLIVVRLIMESRVAQHAGGSSDEAARIGIHG